MRLVPWKQKEGFGLFDELEDIQQEMNRLFDMTLHKPMKMGDGGSHWSPAVDIMDEKDQIKIMADMPGVNKDDIEIDLQNDMLIIKGEKKEEKEIKEHDIVKSERYYGSFYRSFPLPSMVDESKIDAKYNNGVLEIILPKKEESKQKQLKIGIK